MLKKTLTHSFNVLLSPKDYSQLEEMAAEARLSMSNVIRQALKARYLMRNQFVPTCADATPCRVPHMFPQPPQSPPVPT